MLKLTSTRFLTFGASWDGVPENKCWGRVVLDELGREVRCEDTKEGLNHILYLSI